MKIRPCDEARFLNDVKEHEMTVLRDDGVHRHLSFGRPGSSTMRFELITWPWHLCYSGDMGTYVFSRLDDMFQFFRHEPKHSNEGTLYINTGYWAEKCMAVDRSSGLEVYSEEAFKEAILSYDEDGEWDEELRQRVHDEILDYAYDEHAARDSVDRFDGFEFSDFWEHDCKEYSFRFVWCCYAMAWGIKQYDAYKEKLCKNELVKQDLD